MPWAFQRCNSVVQWYCLSGYEQCLDPLASGANAFNADRVPNMKASSENMMTHSSCICCCPLFAVSLIRLALTLSCQLSCKLHLLSGLFQLGCAVQLKVAQLVLKTGAKLPPLLL